MKRHVFLFLITLLFLFSLLSGFQEQQKLPPPERHEVVVRLILLDVIITDDEGNFITDLSKEDFEVYEDGKPRPIHSVELISVKKKELLFEKIPSEEIREEIKSRKRIYVVFDSINTDSITFRRAGEKILNTLNNLLKEGFEIEIIEVNYEQGVKTLNNFTSETKIIEDIISKIGGNLWEWKKGFQERVDIESLSSTDKTKKIEDPLEVQQLYAEETEKRIKESRLFEYELYGRNAFQKSISYLLHIIGMVKKAPGRKSILLISRGIPQLSWKTLVRIFDPFEIISKRTWGNYYEILEEIIRYANTNHISFYCMDLSGVETTGMSNYALINLSEDTGGAYFKGQKKYIASEEVIKRDLKYYYEIAYTPLKDEEDGKFHKVEVKVKRKGLRVRFREGYTDYKEEDLEKRNLAAAFFAPSFYKEIKFNCTTIILPESKKLFRFLLRLNLPLDQFRKETSFPLPEKISFLFGIKEKVEERVHLGKREIDIKNAIEKGFPYYFGYFGTSGIKIKPGDYEAAVVLTHEKEKIGAWEGWIKIPDLKEEKSATILDVVFGEIIKNEAGGRSFTISKRDGSLKLRKYKFIPSWKDRIEKGKLVPVFIQIFSLEKKLIINPEFYYEDKHNQMKICSELIEKIYNKQTKCHSLVYLLHTENLPSGNYIFFIKLFDSSSNELVEKSFRIEII